MTIFAFILVAVFLGLLPARQRQAFYGSLFPSGTASPGIKEWLAAILVAGVLVSLAMNPESRLLFIAIDALGFDLFIVLLGLQLRNALVMARASAVPVVSFGRREMLLFNSRKVVAGLMMVALAMPTVAWIAAGYPLT